MSEEFIVKSPFKNIQRCIDVVSQISDDRLNEISGMIRDRFITFLKHNYGEKCVYDISNLESAIEGDYVVLADTRDIRWLLARACGASDELKRTYILKITPDIEPRVSFTSWNPEHCEVYCDYRVIGGNKHWLTLMPMTAAVMRFPSAVRIRVESVF
jgi:hypothetical protein